MGQWQEIEGDSLGTWEGESKWRITYEQEEKQKFPDVDTLHPGSLSHKVERGVPGVGGRIRTGWLLKDYKQHAYAGSVSHEKSHPSSKHSECAATQSATHRQTRASNKAQKYVHESETSSSSCESEDKSETSSGDDSDDMDDVPLIARVSMKK